MAAEEDWTLGGEHTMQCIHNVLLNSTLEGYTILLINVIPINLIKNII